MRLLFCGVLIELTYTFSSWTCFTSRWQMWVELLNFHWTSWQWELKKNLVDWSVGPLKELPGIEGSSVGEVFEVLPKHRRYFLTRKTKKLVGHMMTVLFIDQAVWWFNLFFFLYFFFHRLRTLTECPFLYVWKSMQLNLIVNSQPQSGRESIFSKGGTCLVFGTSQISRFSTLSRRPDTRQLGT